jgi:dipeptidyl aminopeptidase/acylaminoacyl peptidase
VRNVALLIALAGQALAARQSFSPDDLWLWRQAQTPRISPDGKMVVFVETWSDRDHDADWSNLRLASADGKDSRQSTDGRWRDSNPQWSPDSERIAWISDRTGTPQIFVRRRTGEGETQVTRTDSPPLNISWSPDGNSIAFISRIHNDFRAPSWVPSAIVPFLRKTVEGLRQIFIIPTAGGAPRRITRADLDYPGEPVWMPDGRSLIIGGDSLTLISVADGTSRPLASAPGYYSDPQPSPDGARIAYRFAEPTPQSYSVHRLYVMNADGTRVRPLAGSLDRDPEHLQWSSDSRTVYFAAEDRGVTRVYAARNDGSVRAVELPPARLNGFSLADNGRAVGIRSTAAHADDVVSFTVDVVSQVITIAAPNQRLIEERELGAVEEIGFPSEGRTIQGWLVKPPGFDAANKYPMFLDIQDDPRRMCGVEFRLRAQIIATRGFVVLCANPRGTPGYGDQFGNLLRTRYPGDDFDDLMRGVDFTIAKGFIDPQRLVVSGGLLAAWAIGHTDRFRLAIARRPVSHWVTDVATAPDGLRRATHWMGAMPWDDPDQYVRRSPITFARNFRTPTLILAGEPDPGSDELYFALQAQKVDSAMVRIPATGTPGEIVLELQTILAWLTR